MIATSWPEVDLVSLFHLQHTDRAGRFGPYILPVHDLLIVALGLFQGNLGFFYIGGSIGTVHCIQNRALLHHIAFLKISRQDYLPSTREVTV